MKKILCIGEALIDMICTDKGKSLSDGNNFLKKAIVSGGSIVLDTCVGML
jgi:hypothetical protein